MTAREPSTHADTELGPARALEHAYKTLDPGPLVSRGQLVAFYAESINQCRGEDLTQRMRLGLGRAWGGRPYKGLVKGHSGVGKSTELTRLLAQPLVQSRFRPIRLSVTEHLDPIGFKPFDVLLLMMHEVAKETARPAAEGGLGKSLSDTLLRRISDWFARETRTVEQNTAVAAEAAAGMGSGSDGLWARVLGVFATVRGEMKYASTRKKELVEYRLSQLNTLIDAANALMVDCDRLLRETDGREWLFVIEDFDKAGVAPQVTEDFFVTYANVIRDLECHLVFTLPIALGYSPRAVHLPVAHDRVFCIPDTMVYARDHAPHREGRDAVGGALAARVDPGLFAQGQIERLVVACGGNLRDLFALTSSACDRALLRNTQQVESSDVDACIRELRTFYQRRLGESPFDDALSLDGRDRMTYERKAELLLKIYAGDEAAKVPNPVLYSLLRARAVQEFNGERWFGVHPLVVDILGAQGKVPRRADGKYEGGTI